MSETMYCIPLSEAQAEQINAFIQAKGWSQRLKPKTYYDVEGDYTDTVLLRSSVRSQASGPVPNGRASPTETQVSPEVTLRQSRGSRGSLSSDPSPPLSRDMDSIRQQGRQFKQQSFKGTMTRGSARVPKGDQPEASRSPERAGNPVSNPWRMSSAIGALALDQTVLETSDMSFEHFLVADTNTIKVITRLSTEHVTSVSRVPVRLVLLVDRSGSMLLKLGRDSRHTKITKVKHFAKELVSSLDEDDEIALVTFGEDAEVFFPLEKLNDKTRPVLSEKLNKLDKGGMARETNLSAGLRMALKVFHDGLKGKNKNSILESKNSILIFSDGDINAGTVNTNDLIREVRQNIRQMVPQLDDTQNQWVTISVITTGSCVSEQAYMLSKTCSSEAYYYIAKDAYEPEAELFIPVLLRKSAVAWNVSYTIEAFHDVTFDNEKCSRDFRVRLQRSISGRGPNTEQAYFLYDFPAGHSRQIGVGANWNGETALTAVDGSDAMFKLRVEYTNIEGERFWQEQIITKDDVMDSLHMTGAGRLDANAAACKHELQLVSGDILRSAAEHVKSGDKSKSKAVMESGQKSLEALMTQYGATAQEETSSEASAAVKMYARSVVDNLGALIGTIEKASEGESWNKMKAVSTAIVRETPNTSEAVVDGSVLCPLPEIDHMDSSSMKDPLKRLMARNKKQKRITFGNLDNLLEEELLGKQSTMNP